MKSKKNILAINGSASKVSSNLALINQLIELSKNEFNWTVLSDLTILQQNYQAKTHLKLLKSSEIRY